MVVNCMKSWNIQDNPTYLNFLLFLREFYLTFPWSKDIKAISASSFSSLDQYFFINLSSSSLLSEMLERHYLKKSLVWFTWCQPSYLKQLISKLIKIYLSYTYCATRQPWPMSLVTSDPDLCPWWPMIYVLGDLWPWPISSSRSPNHARTVLSVIQISLHKLKIYCWHTS